MPVLVAESVFERLAQSQADIFDRVMIVDFEIALGLDVDIEKTVAAKGVEHVVEKRHAGFDLAWPLPSTSRLIVISVSLVFRSTFAVRPMIISQV